MLANACKTQAGNGEVLGVGGGGGLGKKGLKVGLLRLPVQVSLFV